MKDDHERTVEALLSPWGAYLIPDLPEGALITEGALIHKIKWQGYIW